MKNLTTHEIHIVSGGALDLFDLGYLWAGYNNLGLTKTIMAGASIGFCIGITNILLPASGAAVVGIASKATWVLIPSIMGAGLAAVEYYIGNYAASYVSA